MSSLMTDMIYVNIFISAVLLLTSIVAFMLMQRVRSLFKEIAPVGALTSVRGPQPGTLAPDGKFATLSGQTITLGSSALPQLVLFVSGSCPISRKMIPIAQDFCFREQLSLILAGDDAPDVQQEFARCSGFSPSILINDQSLGRLLEVDKLPSAFLYDIDGKLVARGLVNNREHLESLLNAWESGYGTVQTYLANHKKSLAA